jgi:hypothetical protein
VKGVETRLRQAQREAVDVMVKAKELAEQTLAEAGITSPDGFPVAPHFEVVLRGYDKQQVDAWGKSIRAAGPGRSVTAPAILVVLRGYSKDDVDRWIERVWHWASGTPLLPIPRADLSVGPSTGRHHKPFHLSCRAGLAGAIPRHTPNRLC